MFAKDIFKDQRVLVSGGRSGIGFAIAKLFLKCGATVMIASRNEDLCKKASKELSVFGTCEYAICDIREAEQVRQLAIRIKRSFEGLDILINNAGGQFPVAAENLSPNGWNTVINNNLNGTFLMTREMALSFFIPQKIGVIVNITAAISRGFPGMIHTGAARAGVENMTKTLAQEWRDYSIRINCVAPGIIESVGLESYPKPIRDHFEKAKESIPMKRFGSVDEVANAVGFLASPMASYINGTTVYVDGAQHLNYDQMGLLHVMKGMNHQKNK